MFKYHLHFASRKIIFATEIISKYKHQINHYISNQTDDHDILQTQHQAMQPCLMQKKNTSSFENNTLEILVWNLEELKFEET